MILFAEVDDHVYEADLTEADGIWTADIWLVSEHGTAKNLMARFIDVECPAVGDQFRLVNQ